MIEYVRGTLAELSLSQAVVEAHGVGFALNISLTTHAALQGRQEVKLYVHEVLTAGGRDDSYVLFGFATREERALYRLLVSVSGVGGASARMILSTLSPAELCEAISSGDERLLKSVKGVGLKTAQRIIVDLKDKMMAEGLIPKNEASEAAADIDKEVRDEAVAALTMLGFPPAPAAKTVLAIMHENPHAPVEQVVKAALGRMK